MRIVYKIILLLAFILLLATPVAGQIDLTDEEVDQLADEAFAEEFAKQDVEDDIAEIVVDEAVKEFDQTSKKVEIEVEEADAMSQDNGSISHTSTATFIVGIAFICIL
jgi:hypothetical protein